MRSVVKSLLRLDEPIRERHDPAVFLPQISQRLEATPCGYLAERVGDRWLFEREGL
jgi:hypothetical protein